MTRTESITLEQRTPVLDVRDLGVVLRRRGSVAYPVDQVSWAVRPGEAIAIVGESGCGKSMSSRGVMRLISPTLNPEVSGSVVLDGEELMSKSEAEMERIRGLDISMIFQDPMTHLNPLMTIGAQITDVLRAHGKPRNAISAAIEHALRSAQVAEVERVRDSYPHQLSGGLRQRALIALALACEPKVLIADEPTTALDVSTQRGILDLLRRLVDEQGMGLVLITHDLGVVAKVCDRVYVMYAGQVVEHASVHDFFADPQHPYSQGLLGAVRSLGAGEERLSTIPGYVPALNPPPTTCRFRERCPFAFEKCEVNPVGVIRGEAFTDAYAACWLTVAEEVTA